MYLNQKTAQTDKEQVEMDSWYFNRNARKVFLIIGTL